MLKRIGNGTQKKEIRVGDCKDLKPFNIGLEFNAPVHGTWNIVHIGLQMPETHQVYVCADNCMRGVVMTAAEMDEIDRFHSVILYEKDILNGSLENETIEGVSDLIKKMEVPPKVIQLFTVCLHHFLGCDLDFVYETLNKRFPDICFIRCFMDPILQRTSYTPEQKLRRAMLEMIKPLDAKKNIYVLGCDVRLKKDSYIFKMANEYGFNVKEIWDFDTFAGYKEIGDGALFITNYPTGILGVSHLANSLGRPYLYLPFTYDEKEIDDNIKIYEETLKSILKDSDSSEEKNSLTYTDLGNISKLKEELKIKARCILEIIKDTEIVIDYTATPRPLYLAKHMLDMGFNVTKVYLDGIFEEERECLDKLKEIYPNLLLSSTIYTTDRTAERDRSKKVLAIGQKAAWFNNTDYFINQIEGGGNIGYEGLVRFYNDLEDAFLNKKDMNSIVPKKGEGLCSCSAVRMS